MNGGKENIAELTVLFPGGEVAFGNILVGATTPYIAVPHGVYKYAAYRYRSGGVVHTQPVMDWVGEAPMFGTHFTYKVEFESSKAEGRPVTLLEVKRDE